jgi:hypothetical protein
VPPPELELDEDELDEDELDEDDQANAAWGEVESGIDDSTMAAPTAVAARDVITAFTTDFFTLIFLLLFFKKVVIRAPADPGPAGGIPFPRGRH